MLPVHHPLVTIYIVFSSSHDTSVFRDEITSRRHANKSRGGSSSSHRQPAQDDDSNAIGMLPSRREFEESLREGRLEAVVSRLYQQTVSGIIWHWHWPCRLI